MNRFKELVKPGVIISCQALEGEPLYREEGGIMNLMALAAQQSGAVGIRANGLVDIPQISATVDIPVLSIYKVVYPDAEVYITSTMDEVDALMNLGCVKLVAIDCTSGKRHNGEKLEDFIQAVKEKYPNLVIMADIATYEEAITASKLGVDAISTTMYGNTTWSTEQKPGVEIIRKLTSVLDIPVIAEGGIYTEEHIHQVFDAGAYACVIGGAVTRPQEITERFVRWYKETK